MNNNEDNEAISLISLVSDKEKNPESTEKDGVLAASCSFPTVSRSIPWLVK